MAERISDAEIAQRREVEISTIEKQIEGIYRTLEVHTRGDAMALLLHVQRDRLRRELAECRKESARLLRENNALRAAKP